MLRTLGRIWLILPGLYGEMDVPVVLEWFKKKLKNLELGFTVRLKTDIN